MRPSSVTADRSVLGLRRCAAVEIPTPGAGASLATTCPHMCESARVECLLVVELLGLCVQRRALLDGGEASDLQCLACLRDGLDPWGLLATGTALLADDLAVLVLDEVLRSQAANSLLLASTENHGLGHLAPRNLAHRLLLHCLHGLHGCLLLHDLHGLHGCLLLHHLHGLHGSHLLHHLHGLHGCLLLHHLHGLHGCLL